MVYSLWYLFIRHENEPFTRKIEGSKMTKNRSYLIGIAVEALFTIVVIILQSPSSNVPSEHTLIARYAQTFVVGNLVCGALLAVNSRGFLAGKT